MDERIVLSAESLTREIAGRRVVDGVSFDAKRGEVLAVLGPSGSGKSSLLRLLNLLDEPTGGRVLLDGIDTKTLPPRELRRRVGMVLQTPFLFPGTIADNLAFGPRQRGADLSSAQLEELLNRVRLAGYGERDANRLSGGEAQRVSVARTLANDPEVLLLDEPTSALDAESKQDVESLVASIVRERDLACILVTHDPQQARRLASRVMLLAEGKVRTIGPATEVLDRSPAQVLGAL